MSAILHGADCPEHGLPFPHRVITSQKVIRNRGLAVTEMIVCALCGHWIARRVPGCRCPASCHMEARDGEPIGITVAIKSKTG